MSTFTIPNVFIANTKIKSAAMNANFSSLASTLNTNLLPAVGNPSALVTTSAGGNLQSLLPIGTEGQTLVVNPTATSTGGLEWATPSTGTSASETYNLGLSMSATAGALTIALKQGDGTTDPAAGTGAVKVALRNPLPGVGGYNERSITTPLSLTISSGTTLGMMASQNNALWVYLVDTDGAGTMGLAASTVRMDDGRLQNVIPESFQATIAIGAGTVTTSASPNGLSPRDAVVYTTTGALPTDISAGTKYWVDTASLTGTSFDPCQWPEFGPITSSGSQSGTHTVHVANTRIVGSSLLSGVAIRLVGRAIFNLVTPGTWLAPSEVSLQGSINYDESISATYYGFSNFDNITDSHNCNLACYRPLSDTHGVLNGVTIDGITRFVAPISGAYNVCFSYRTNTVSMASSSSIQTYVVVSGSGIIFPSDFVTQTAGTFAVGSNGSLTVNAEAGDYIEVVIVGIGTTINAPATDTGATSISITLVGESVL